MRVFSKEGTKFRFFELGELEGGALRNRAEMKLIIISKIYVRGIYLLQCVFFH